ncbi:MAG: tetratricopeptide repeat protein [Cyanobacteria bacterium J06592_8]
MTIEHSLNCYEHYLLALETVNSPQRDQVLNVLVSRDAVQRTLIDGAKFSGVQWVKLKKLDDRLKQQKDAIAKTLDLEQWRETVKPSESAWWWFCDLPKPLGCWERFDWVWNGVNLICLTISVSLVLDTSSKLLTGGPGFVGASAIAFQSILTLVAGGGGLTQTGQKTREYVFTRLNIDKRYWEEWSAGVSVALLGVLFAIHSSLPKVAVRFNDWGVEHYQAREFDSALSNYEKAIALRPDYAEAHYYLGLLYEDLQQYDKARAEYQLALQSDLDALEALTRLKAHNNLGRLYILKKDYTAAIPSLVTGLNLVDEEQAKTDEAIKSTQYALKKNLGWTQLGQKNYIEAESLLTEAIALAPERGAAYCLLAQVLEGKKQQTEAQTQWQNCVIYADELQPDEYQWIALAREKIATQGKQP